MRKLRHSRGFGVHSPFAFDLITNVIGEKGMYYSYNEIESIRRKHLHNTLSNENLLRRKEISFKRAALLFRLVNRFRPNTLLEIGTSWGISTLYLHAGYPKTSHICVESDRVVAEISQKILIETQTPVQIHQAEEQNVSAQIMEQLPSIDFLFIHRNDRAGYYLELYRQLTKKITNQTIWVIEDIHANDEIYRQWKQLTQRNEVRVTMDLYDFGLIFCNQKLNKQDYIVAF